MDRFMTHSFGAKAIAHAASTDLVHTLRVLLDPAKAEGLSVHVCIAVDGEAAGLRLRNCVAVPTDGRGAEGTASMTRATFVSVLSGKVKWSDADITVTGDSAAVDAVRRCLDHATLPA
jgi:hypothetical protein